MPLVSVDVIGATEYANITQKLYLCRALSAKGVSFDMLLEGATTPVHERDLAGPEGPKAETRFSVNLPERVPVFSPL